ncbi:MAG: hypothetical protein VCB81_00315, partial [Verrucomicrobiia bacterium]
SKSLRVFEGDDVELPEGIPNMPTGTAKIQFQQRPLTSLGIHFTVVCRNCSEYKCNALASV